MSPKRKLNFQKNHSSIVILFFILFNPFNTIAAPKQELKTFKIVGQIAGLSKGKLIITYKKNYSQSITDSISIVNGHFNYKGYIREPTVATFLLNNIAKNFYIEPKTIYLIAQKDSFNLARLKGSDINDDYQKSNFLIDKKIESNRTNSIIEEDRKVLFECDVKFIETYPESYYSLILLDFHFPDLDYDFIKNSLKKVSKDYRSYRLFRDINDRLRESEKISVGNKMSNFSLKTRQNKIITLSEVVSSNKYILIDFWASWCYPCRKNSSFLKKIYTKYKDKRFTILSISLDKDTSAWSKAILIDQIDSWHHGIDKDKISIEKFLGISSIPIFILLNNELDIVGKYSGRWYGNKKLSEKLDFLLNNELLKK